MAARTPDPHERLTLRAGTFTLQVAPGAGGAIANWFSDWPERRLHWFRPTQPGLADPLALGCFPMAPFCNRIRQGRAHAQGRAIRLPAHPETAPHALHGHAWRQPWRLVGHGEYWAELQQMHAAGGWPWRHTLTHRIELHATRGLRLTLSVRNEDSAPMPVGLGLHPYFPRRPGTRVTLEAGALWHHDAQRLPTQHSTEAPVLRALAAGTGLDDLLLDHDLTGWNGRATIHWPGDGAAMEIIAGAPLNAVALLTPRGRDWFCLEPVSNTADWLHEPTRRAGEVGGSVVRPGETLGCWARFVPLLT